MGVAVAAHEIERFAVDSSSLKSVGYADGVCVCEFVNGHLYAYPMAHAEFEKFALAESKGRYFNQSIKGKFAGEKLTSRCGKCGSEPEVVGLPCRECTSVILAMDLVHKERS